jgi:hypothetical protein
MAFAASCEALGAMLILFLHFGQIKDAPFPWGSFSSGILKPLWQFSHEIFMVDNGFASLAS